MAALPLDAAVSALLRRAGRPASPLRIEPMTSGGNNRVFRVHLGDDSCVAKWYFHGAADGRDRLGSEYAFLERAWASGLRCVPQPLACDRELRVALYEFIDGRRLGAAEIDEARVTEAAHFFAALNDPVRRRGARALAAASEACFSVAAHAAMVDERLARFASLRGNSEVDREAIEYITRLGAIWGELKERIFSSFAKPGDALEERWRCVSPSDFGFHNALLRPDGRLCFLDFEYAGWDDPAKAFGDFFAHPGLPVPRAHRAAFLRVAAAPFDDPEALVARAGLLEPIFRVKWCCIILNEFLPASAERRRFADPHGDADAAKRVQLQKARRLAIDPAA